jgi:pantoate--beta-alanine ligase
MRIARRHADELVASIFVNPTQFGPAEDLAKYPRPFDRDCRLAESEKCSAIFHPESAEVYPAQYRTHVMVEELSGRLCGISRPDHFRGVATVVLKLLNIVAPDIAVFGQKDAQQAIVLKRMISDLNVPVRLIVAPTVREPDGLAMSSRNVYLTARERADVPLIFEGLRAAQRLFESGERSAERLLNAVRDTHNKASAFKSEYIELVDVTSLSAVTAIAGPALLAIACRTAESNTRLIDNIILGGEI